MTCGNLGALALRRDGYSYRAIAAMLGITVLQAYKGAFSAKREAIMQSGTYLLIARLREIEEVVGATVANIDPREGSWVYDDLADRWRNTKPADPDDPSKAE